ncbi:methyl-accepting chemotaxis sensory transducer [hydrothermal vent metagenome]|uniref:Methyl-accepting chemotaxis sensory transducer n=1 Tax=hydrothermal vent metagenome TaxID=652676 RepID=A0A3B1BR35_9ZZZZ
MTIQRQLLLMTLLVLLGLGTVIAVSGLAVHRLTDKFDRYEHILSDDKDLIDIKATALSVSRVDPILPETQDAMDKANGRIKRLLTGLHTSMRDKAMLTKLAGIAEQWGKYSKGIYGAIKIASDAPQDALNIPDAMYQLYLAPMTTQLDAMVSHNSVAEVQARNNIVGNIDTLFWSIALPLLMVGILVIFFIAAFSRRLKRGLKDIISSSEALAQGDLGIRIPVRTRDEIGQISQAINHFVDGISTILAEVRDASEHTRESAVHLNDLFVQLSTNTQSQSDEVMHISAAIEEMNNSITDTANSAVSATETTEQTSSSVKTGLATGQGTRQALAKINDAVTAAVNALQELDTAAQSIGTVSQIISNTAEQTNLLALNAAIEAARAGAHGRGFSVVADEVRLLAQRTTKSTSNILSTIDLTNRLLEQAKEAMNLVRDETELGVTAGERIESALSDINDSMETVAGRMQQIAAATEEQDNATGEITKSIETVASLAHHTRDEIESTHQCVGVLVSAADSVQTALSRFSRLPASNGSSL